MSKFAIIDAVEKPKTQRTGLRNIRGRTWKWEKVFLCPTKKAKSKCAATSIRPDGQPMGQAPERGGALSIVPLYPRRIGRRVCPAGGVMEKEQYCECGLTESGKWSEQVFDRYGCECPMVVTSRSTNPASVPFKNG